MCRILYLSHFRSPCDHLDSNMAAKEQTVIANGSHTTTQCA